MGNQEWLDKFGCSIAHFHPEGLFDHCPCTIIDKSAKIGGKKSFKYFNMWGTTPNFKDSVGKIWSTEYRGTKMFFVIKKLKALKPILKSLNRECFSDIENNTTIASMALENIQKALVDKPSDAELMQQEMDLAHDLKDLITVRDSFQIQKAKVQWSLKGDLNTSYFHHIIKNRMMLNKVFQIEDNDGMICTEGSHTHTDEVNVNVVRKRACCNENHWDILARSVTAEEVKNSIFSIPKSKSPGPDGYTSQFFRDAWDVIEDEVKGDVKSIMLILRVLATLSATSGLKVNASKSEVVFNGVSDSLKQDITQISGYQEEKIVAKVRGIGVRKLSYAGRTILINYLFNTLHNYWASIFFIPKGVIKRIEAICRNFLWCGESKYSRAPLVSWQGICFKKKEGGLSIQEAGVWNAASVGKLIYWLYTKADILWVMWIDHVYLKGTNWDSYQPPLDSNWNWRNICRVKGLLEGGYQGNCWIASTGGYSVGAGYQWIQGSHPLSIGIRMCILCEVGEETHEHLFGNYPYSSLVIAGIEQWLCLSIA
ncbi:uncharacterized protein LOC141641042 [Silene latifolia]|uniref:uncharacterized protein LOC141641042 n=1 Tax=Silene latifolia TaxID=37657 RepID=UPI003D780585